MKTEKRHKLGKTGRVVLASTILFVLVLLFLIVLKPAAPTNPGYEKADLERRTSVIAHRGGAGLWPENTLYAFRKASDIGADVLEMDVHRSADGVLVIIHDDRVDRTTGGEGAVAELTLAELKGLDAGHSWTGDQGASYPFRGQGITVPTLEEVFIELPHMPMLIEIKEPLPSVADSLCRAVKDFGMGEQVVVASAHSSAMQAFRRQCPQVATSAYRLEVLLFLGSGLVPLGDLSYQAPAEFMSIPNRVNIPWGDGVMDVVNVRNVAKLHGSNRQINVWTVNAQEEMQVLLDLEVDGIVTDYPDRLLNLVRE